MPWDTSATAGFTAEGVTPWLPVGDAAAGTVAGPRADPGSVLGFCRRLLALRRAELGGRIDGYELVAAGGGLWAYRAGDLIVALNLSDASAGLTAEAGEVLLATPGADPAGGAGLGPWQGLVARCQAAG